MNSTRRRRAALVLALAMLNLAFVIAVLAIAGGAAREDAAASGGRPGGHLPTARSAPRYVPAPEVTIPLPSSWAGLPGGGGHRAMIPWVASGGAGSPRGGGAAASPGNRPAATPAGSTG
ncbi:MAG: hypothetical protein M3301_02430, partial [Chloroflexota bacterium]|nr:hypothetical protein [Chloroflexota bacterium]